MAGRRAAVGGEPGEPDPHDGHGFDAQHERVEKRGGSVSYGTSGFGVSASMSKANGDANRDATSQNTTHVSAANRLSIVSGGDTEPRGGGGERQGGVGADRRQPERGERAGHDGEPARIR